MIHLKQLTTKEEWAESYPVMSELRTELDEETYLQSLKPVYRKNRICCLPYMRVQQSGRCAARCREYPFIKGSTYGLRIL